MKIEKIQAALSTRLSRIVHPFRRCLETADEPVADLLNLIEHKGDSLVTLTADSVIDHLPMVIERRLRRVLLARPRLVEGWPWPQDIDAGRAVHELLSLSNPDLPPSERSALGWPSGVSLVKVAEWSRSGLNREFPTERFGDCLCNAAEKGEVPAVYVAKDKRGAARRVQPVGLALLYLADRDIRAGLRRPAIAIDAGKTHHGFLLGVRDLPKAPRKKHEFLPGRSNELELLGPGGTVRLSLRRDVMSEDQLVHALRDWRGWFGLRNWAALLRLLSVEGRRSGWVRWTLGDHLHALGYSRKRRKTRAVGERVAREVELLTQIELAVYRRGSLHRERRPLFLVGSRFERLSESQWRLDGMELRINPLLYHGVRHKRTGKLGRNWWWAPTELAQIDQRRNPHALALGLVLPIRWRWAFNQEKDHVAMSGESLLKTGGIPLSKHDPGRAWRLLERDLAKLQEIGALACWEWKGPQNTLGGNVLLYPPAWVLDRIMGGTCQRL